MVVCHAAAQEASMSHCEYINRKKNNAILAYTLCDAFNETTQFLLWKCWPTSPPPHIPNFNLISASFSKIYMSFQKLA